MSQTLARTNTFNNASFEGSNRHSRIPPPSNHQRNQKQAIPHSQRQHAMPERSQRQSNSQITLNEPRYEGEDESDYESPPELVPHLFDPTAAPAGKRKRNEDLEAAENTRIHRKSILTGEMMSAARQLYGRYFNISDHHADMLVAKFFGDYAASDTIRKNARKQVLDWKRNWQSRIVKALREHVIDAAKHQPNFLRWAEEAVLAHFHSLYDLETMCSSILLSISQVVDIKSIQHGPLASLYITWYIHMCWLILKEISPYLKSNRPEDRSLANQHTFSEGLFQAFRMIALQLQFKEITVEDVPTKAPRGSGGGRNKKKKL
jgi:hypothetical protein